MSVSLALAVAIAAAPVAAWAKEKEVFVSHVTTEAQLQTIMLQKSYGGLTSGHVAFKVDIRPNPLTVGGQRYDGYIAIQARDDKGQYCHWYMVIDPRIVWRIDKTLPADPSNLQVDWFMPRIYKRDNGCWNPELNDDGSILAFGLAEWRTNAMHDLETRFLNLPFASQHPMAAPQSSLYGKVEFASDRITLVVGQLMMKDPGPSIGLPKLLPIPLQKK